MRTIPFAKPLAAAFAVTALLGLSACSDDDPEPTPTPTPTASASPSHTADPRGLPVHLVCPEPIGTVDALTSDAEDDPWAPAYIVGTEEVLWPVAFGEITFEDSTGATGTEPAKTKPNEDGAGSVTCDFTVDITGEDDQGNPITGTATGTVAVVQYTPPASPSPSAS